MPVIAKKSDLAKAHKTEITPQRAEYIRSQMASPIEELQNETGLSEYVIETIIEAKKNDFYRDASKAISKFDKLTEDMKYYLRTVDFENWAGLRRKFNRAFSYSDLTPMHDQTLKTYYRRLQ